MILLSCSFVAMACSCRAASSGCIFTDGVIELIIPIQLARPMTSVASLPSRKRRGRRELVVAFDWFPLGFRRLRSPPFGQLKHLRRKNKNIFNFSKKKGEKWIKWNKKFCSFSSSRLNWLGRALLMWTEVNRVHCGLCYKTFFWRKSRFPRN